MKGGHPTYLNQRRFPLLDGLRCIAIVAVIWFHSVDGSNYTSLLTKGNQGVSLFFVISGFLITTLLLRERDGIGDISLRRFYIRRTLRIFPLYYGMLALYVILVAVVERHSEAGAQFWQNLPYFLTYTSNWFVPPLDSHHVIFLFAWSLATEEQFYLFWPWIVRAGAKPAALVAVMLTIIVAHYIAMTAGAGGSTVLPARILFHLSPPICMGAIAALMLHSPKGFRWVEPLINARYGGLAALIALTAALSIDGVPDWVWFLTMTWLVAACVVRPGQGLAIVLAQPIVRHIGVVSYGMYLMHLLWINVAQRILHMHDDFSIFIIALLLSIVAASISFRYFETPILNMKDRLAKRPESPIHAA